MIKRLFDMGASALALLMLFPVFAGVAVWIAADSRGGIFYRQIRVGKNEKRFYLIKFRTMVPGAEKKGLLTVGSADRRITRAGRFLRKYKLDELPQLYNVLRGDMSMVGPRPEVEKYVSLYTDEQKNVLTVRPGLTDLASLRYFDENEILAKSDDPEREYRLKVMPEKLALNLRYIRERNFVMDIRLIALTLLRILRRD